MKEEDELDIRDNAINSGWDAMINSLQIPKIDHHIVKCILPVKINTFRRMQSCIEFTVYCDGMQCNAIQFDFEMGDI